LIEIGSDQVDQFKSENSLVGVRKSGLSSPQNLLPIVWSLCRWSGELAAAKNGEVASGLIDDATATVCVGNCGTDRLHASVRINMSPQMKA
jgi:hypothetical protein